MDVWVELGLQSASDKTAELINRGYKTEVFERAVRILAAHGIPVVAHLIVGLPGEGVEDAVRTAEYLARYDASMFPHPSVTADFALICGEELLRRKEEILG